MNILVVSQYFYPENLRINSLCTELAARGHKVDVLTGYPQYPQGRIYDGYGFKIPYEKNWNGVTVHRVKTYPRGRTPLGLLNNCVSFVCSGERWVKKCRTKYDAVYFFGISPLTSALPAISYGKKFDVPVYVNIQDLWPDNVEHVLGVHNRIILGVLDRMMDRIYAGSRKLLCSSEGFVRRLSERGVAAEKLAYWPQFCEEPDFERLEKPECFADDFNIVFAGNIGEAQGLDLLVDAAELMKNERVRWYLVGDGRAAMRLRKRVEEAGLCEKVIFVGKKTEHEANCYVRYADCAYLSFADNPIFDMTIPAKLQTYLACGVPILAAAGGESARLVQSNHCGVTAERNADSVCAAVRTLMECDSGELRQNSRRCYEENFTKKQLIDMLEGIMCSETEYAVCKK